MCAQQMTDNAPLVSEYSIVLLRRCQQATGSAGPGHIGEGLHDPPLPLAARNEGFVDTGQGLPPPSPS